MFYFCVMKITKSKLRKWHVKLIGLPDCNVVHGASCIVEHAYQEVSEKLSFLSDLEQMLLNIQTNVIVGEYLNSQIDLFMYTSIDCFILFCKKLV